MAKLGEIRQASEYTLSGFREIYVKCPECKKKEWVFTHIYDKMAHGHYLLCSNVCIAKHSDKEE